MRIQTREILRNQYKAYQKQSVIEYKKDNPKSNMRSIKAHAKKQLPFVEFCQIYFGVRRGMVKLR